MPTLKKYGTPTEVSAITGDNRRTLLDAANRGEIATGRTVGGTLLLLVSSAQEWSANGDKRKRGPKPKKK